MKIWHQLAHQALMKLANFFEDGGEFTPEIRANTILLLRDAARVVLLLGERDV